MNTPQEVWRHINALLDAGHDPFDDEQVVEALLKEPALLAPLEQLCGHLRQVQELPADWEAPLDPRAPLTPLALPFQRWVAAALLVLAVGASSWWLLPQTSREEPQPGAQRPAPPLSRIHSFRSHVSYERRDAPLPAATTPVLVSWNHTWTTP